MNTNEFVPLVEPIIPALRRYARALLKERAAADDLVQDCLERVIARWHQRRGADDTRAWMFAIMHNLAISRLRQLARRGEHIALETANDIELVSPPRHDDSLAHRELLRALDQLTEDQRTVLLLVSVEDLSYDEVAQVLDVPIGTVMSRVARARDKLSSVMSGERNASRPTLRRVK